MNKSSIIEVLKDSKLMSTNRTIDFESILSEYPYFQAARVLYLKGLKIQNSFHYNQNLKTTASHTTDRSILFDFITSKEFDDGTTIYDQETQTIANINAYDKQVENNLNNYKPTDFKPYTPQTNNFSAENKTLDNYTPLQLNNNLTNTASDFNINTPPNFNQKSNNIPHNNFTPPPPINNLTTEFGNQNSNASFNNSDNFNAASLKTNDSDFKIEPNYYEPKSTNHEFGQKLDNYTSKDLNDLNLTDNILGEDFLSSNETKEEQKAVENQIEVSNTKSDQIDVPQHLEVNDLDNNEDLNQIVTTEENTILNENFTPNVVDETLLNDIYQEKHQNDDNKLDLEIFDNTSEEKNIDLDTSNLSDIQSDDKLKTNLEDITNTNSLTEKLSSHNEATEDETVTEKNNPEVKQESEINFGFNLFDEVLTDEKNTDLESDDNSEDNHNENNKPEVDTSAIATSTQEVEEKVDSKIPSNSESGKTDDDSDDFGLSQTNIDDYLSQLNTSSTNKEISNDVEESTLSKSNKKISDTNITDKDKQSSQPKNQDSKAEASKEETKPLTFAERRKQQQAQSWYRPKTSDDGSKPLSPLQKAFQQQTNKPSWSSNPITNKSKTDQNQYSTPSSPIQPNTQNWYRPLVENPSTNQNQYSTPSSSVQPNTQNWYRPPVENPSTNQNNSIYNQPQSWYRPKINKDDNPSLEKKINTPVPKEPYKEHETQSWYKPVSTPPQTPQTSSNNINPIDQVNNAPNWYKPVNPFIPKTTNKPPVQAQNWYRPKITKKDENLDNAPKSPLKKAFDVQGNVPSWYKPVVKKTTDNFSATNQESNTINTNLNQSIVKPDNRVNTPPQNHIQKDISPESWYRPVLKKSKDPTTQNKPNSPLKKAFDHQGGNIPSWYKPPVEKKTEPLKQTKNETQIIEQQQTQLSDANTKQEAGKKTSKFDLTSWFEIPSQENLDFVEKVTKKHNHMLTDNSLDLESSEKKENTPIKFGKEDEFSFNDWLNVSDVEPIDRSNEGNNNNPDHNKSSNFNDKLELIDEFIVKNPKIEPPKQNPIEVEQEQYTLAKDDDIITETLARIYVLQSKFDEAERAYKILSLKFPEKSSFFASQIRQIQILKNTNL